MPRVKFKILSWVRQFHATTFFKEIPTSLKSFLWNSADRAMNKFIGYSVTACVSVQTGVKKEFRKERKTEVNCYS